MLHSLFDINPTRLNGINGRLQRMQDDPGALQRARARFDEPPPDDPPPPYSSYTTTQPATPIPPPTPPVQLTAEEMDELLRRPLNNSELSWFRKLLHAYRPAYPFEVETKKERERIQKELSKRNSMGIRIYGGPSIYTRHGNQRLDIMVRNSIRKRWEALGVWNPEWGVPIWRRNWGIAIIGVEFGDNQDPDAWSWKWRTRPGGGAYYLKPHEEQVASWPPRDEEYVDDRAIRRYLESKGQSVETQVPSNSDTTMTWEDEVDPDESRITTRPWYQWKIEVLEEAIKLHRLSRVGGLSDENQEAAAVKIKEQWKAKGDWKDSWGDSPGWKWKHESPSPEPEDPNNMDFSPSELDAFEAIPPPTPPPPILFRPPTEEEMRFFPFLGLKGPQEPSLPELSEQYPSGDETGFDGDGAVNDVRDTNQPQDSNNLTALTDRQSETCSTTKRKQGQPLKTLSRKVAQSTSLRAKSTRSPRKRRRDESNNDDTGESMSTETREQKRRRTSERQARDPAPNGTTMRSQLLTATAREQPPTRPRRSARIAELQARQNSNRSTKAETSRDRNENAISTTTKRNKRMKSKQSCPAESKMVGARKRETKRRNG